MMADLTPVTLDRNVTWPPILKAIQPVAAHLDAPLYLVGGAVRDVYLRRDIQDLDFVTAGDGQKAARAIANTFHGAYYPLDSERGIGRALIDFDGQRYEIDVSRFRGETLLDDLIGRDFTINAMAFPLEGDPQQIIDPLDGLTDLRLRHLRRCSPSSISDDPIRALRAIRQAVALKLQVEPRTRADIRAVGAHLFDTSVERVRDEFMKILDGPSVHAALRALDAVGLLPIIIPEVTAMHGITQRPPHLFDVWEHTLKVIEALETIIAIISPERTDETAADGFYGMVVYRLDRYRPFLQRYLAQEWPNGRTTRALLMLSALLHDCGKPATRTVGEDGMVHFYQHEVYGSQLAAERVVALRLSNEEGDRVKQTVLHHMRPMNFTINGGDVSRRALHRYWNGTGLAGIDVCILTQADYLGTYGVTIELKPWLAHLEVVAQLLEGYYMQHDAVVTPPPLINGNDLMQHLDVSPGPQIGRVLRLLAEAQAAGEVTTIDEAYAFAEAHYNDRDSTSR